MMKTSKGFPKAAAFLAAFILTAGVPLSAAVFPDTAITAYAEEEYTFGSNGSYDYKKYSDHIAISSAKSIGSTLEIPSAIDGMPVTAVDIYAFECCDMTTIVFPDTITEIGPYAFSMCKKLESVTFPDSIKKVSFQAFKDCPALKTINFPDHLVETGDYTFENTPWLDAQRQKDPLVVVNGALIDGRTCQGKVTIPNGVKYVASGAFSKNENVTSVVFPASVTNEQENTFFYCPNLTSVEMPGISSLGMFTFAGCNKLTDIKISGNISRIDGYTFSDSTATATITFYGSQEKWNSVEKPANDEFLKRAHIVFDESYQPPVEEVIGDINADGKCDTADAVLLTKWLLTKETLTADQGKIADLDKDGKLTAVDLSQLKKIILTAK